MDVNPRLDDNKLIWGGKRAYHSHHLMLKLGMTEVSSFFKFYSENNGRTHEGKTEMRPLILKNPGAEAVNDKFEELICANAFFEN
jgi:hypothetical protein